MEQTTNDQRSPDVSAIFRLIRKVRRALRGSWVAAGLAITVALYLAALLAVALLDLLVPLWPAMRLIGLVVVIVPAAWALLTGVLLPAVRRLGNRQVARRIERHLPGIHNRLVSCVDLSLDQKHQGHSREFYRRLVGESLERIRGFKPSTVVNLRRLRRAGMAAGCALLAFLAAWVLLSDRLPTAMARILSPFADIPPATGVLFTVEPGDARLPRGDDIHFRVQVTRGQPRDLRLELVFPGQPIWHELQEQGARRWTRTLRGIEKSFSYRVHGGGTWSPLHHVTLVDRPRIVSLGAQVHYPAYLGITAPLEASRQSIDVTGPEDSQVELRVGVEGQAVDGEIQILESRQESVPVSERGERVWFVDKIPAGAVPEGNWQWEHKRWDADESERHMHGEPPAAGVHGHLFHSARIPFEVRPGEHLFAYVYVPADQLPETIMLQWHDGQNWEHRAYWGQDKIDVGQPGTASRQPMGPLPEPGRWVRLEVPAKAVGLEGQAVRGMAFTTSGGQCHWHLAGALPPPHRIEQRFVVSKTYPIKPVVARAGEKSGKQKAGKQSTTAGKAQWSGRFPLVGEGLYRVELRNELGHANQTMKEARFAAIVDEPPQVTLERPAGEVVLSQPAKVPLVIAAYDDFALKDVTVLVERAGSGGFRGSPWKRYQEVVRGDTLVAPLDVARYDLEPGEQLRYRVEVRDRKDQVAQTPDFVIRIAADDNAADRQLARFEQTQDTFQEKLVQLIAEQAKIRDEVRKMEAQFAPLDDKIKAAQAQAAAEARRQAETNPQAPPPAAVLDPDDAGRLAELRRQLGQLAGQEEQNTNLARQLASELGQSAQQAAQLQMLPPELIDELRAVQQAFEGLAVAEMQELAGRMRQSSSAADVSDPRLDQLGRSTDQVQQQLEAVARRLEALARAREQMAANIEQALAQLRGDVLGQRAADTAQGFGDLQEMIAALREQLEGLEGRQAELLDATDVVPDVLLSDLEKQQGRLDIDAEPPLAQARQLLGRPRPGRMRRQSGFADAPALGDEDEVLAPPEEDPGEAEDGAEDAQVEQTPDDAGEHEEEDEALFEPALGGPPPKLDPRYADKRRTLAGRPQPGRASRQELAERQFEQLKALNLSQQSLASDEASLERLLAQFERILGHDRTPVRGEPPSQPAGSQDVQPGDAELGRLMQSPEVEKALALAERVEQLRSALAAARAAEGQPAQSQDQSSSPLAGARLGSLRRLTSSGQVVDAELAQLDPATRGMILKMQPQMREELLQGMREQGPEGYRQFIQDYFQRLSRVKALD
ncbi:MAG: hypothetical protein WD847_00095 [Pirellulales bacterium]